MKRRENIIKAKLGYFILINFYKIIKNGLCK